MKGYSVVINPITGSMPTQEWDAPIRNEVLQSAVGGHVEHVADFNCMRIKDMDWLEVTDGVAYKHNDADHMGFAVNALATSVWHSSYRILHNGKQLRDLLHGPIVFVWGDDEFMAAL